MPHDCPQVAPPPPPPPPVLKTPQKSLENPHSSVDEDYEGIRRKVRCFDKDLMPFITIYHSMEPILQKGPQCGLVALGMISALTDQKMTMEDIVQVARDREFTNIGEMFSVDDMAKLAKAVLPPCEVHIMKGMAESREAVYQQLSFGALLLVPIFGVTTDTSMNTYTYSHEFIKPLAKRRQAYKGFIESYDFLNPRDETLSKLNKKLETRYDSDCNNEPCCKRGHKAHWAAVCGAMIFGNQQCMVFARQGKSRYVSLWDYALLARSNANLVELDPSRREDGNDYLLPPGGVEQGLCDRFILIKGLPKLLKPLIIL